MRRLHYREERVEFSANAFIRKLLVLPFPTVDSYWSKWTVRRRRISVKILRSARPCVGTERETDDRTYFTNPFS